MPINSVTELVRSRADTHGDLRLYTFLKNGEEYAGHLTLADVDRQSRAVAAVLQETTSTGDCVLLMYAPGLDFITGFLGCLYAGIIAVPAYAPNPVRPERYIPRLSSIAASAGTSTILTSSDQAGRLPQLLHEFEVFESARILATNQIDASSAENWKPVQADSDTLALLQYTSGSTSDPKGVMVSHGNILHNLAFIDEREANEAGSISVTWLPSFHDMGLLEGILSPLYGTYPLYIMSPLAFIQRPVRWLSAISKCRATNSGGPNFAYEYCIQMISEEQRADLDLSSWRVAYNGSEPVHMDTMKKFSAAFKTCGFRFEAFCPVYGLAESTALAAGTHRSTSPSQQISGKSNTRTVSCGKAEMNSRVLAVDPGSRLECNAGVEGEIWLSGPCIAQGYWKNPEETDRVFNAYLADSGDGPFLRTGDLGYLRDGEVYITGRIKDLIILRGRKLFPQDIEYSAAFAHPMIRQNSVAAFSVEDGNSEHLVILAELDLRRKRKNLMSGKASPDQSNGDYLEIAQSIVETVSREHEARISTALLLAPGQIARTSSGKIQRFRCRERFLGQGIEALYRWDIAKKAGAVTEPASQH
jgi:acyl-CoA synthetase (AMP-forming)/AMP-acid ligase II